MKSERNSSHDSLNWVLLHVVLIYMCGAVWCRPGATLVLIVPSDKLQISANLKDNMAYGCHYYSKPVWPHESTGLCVARSDQGTAAFKQPVHSMVWTIPGNATGGNTHQHLPIMLNMASGWQASNHLFLQRYSVWKVLMRC